MNPQTEV